MPYNLPAVAACLTLLLYLVITLRVGQARNRFGVRAPATTGHPVFERAFRVQMNTLEQLALFLPAMFLFSAYVSPLWAGVGGFVWVAGRTWYAVGYFQAADRRRFGYLIGLLASVALLIGAAAGAIVAFF
jgi:glutathione S-transferase